MIDLAGRGLHGGAPVRVTLRREPGAVRLRSAGGEARLAELDFDGVERSTCARTRDGRVRVRTVEHLFAALAALSVRDGVAVELDGPELPLLDGGARAYVDALRALGLGACPPALRVMRAGTIDVGGSRYEVRPPSSDEVRVEVEVDFDALAGAPRADGLRLARHARWDGDASDFRERIAPARTFGFERELDALTQRGLASHVEPSSVVLIGPDRVLSAGRPFVADEPARHKLLDLVGDLYAHGGPPIGWLRADRPGHAATHEAVRRGLADGLLMRTRTR